MKRLIKKILNILILISLFSIFSIFTLAQTGCCELTVEGEYCQTVDAEQCIPGANFAPTSCEQTSYCKLGCCYSSDSGRCFMQAPRAACEKEDTATWNDDPKCDFALCKKGCCIISDQAFFVTEIQCRKTVADYEGVEFQFKEGINTESECIAEAQNKDQGCCVKNDGNCIFTTRDNCPEAKDQPEQITNQSRKKPGFYKDMLCSHETLGCDCAKQSTTGCVGENLYWFDSCGNRENIYDRDQVRSYNRGFILSEENSCTISGAFDINCGNCNYAYGTVCGTDTENRMPVGNNICIDLNCATTYDDPISPNADGGAKKHGESWCVYDSVAGQSRDLVGSRHYRNLCINGEEIVEPCKDFRDEICVQGVMGGEVFNNIEALTGSFRDEDYIEAGCRDNRWQDCFACNQITKVHEEEVEAGDMPDAIQEARMTCCNDLNARDCIWVEGVLPGAPAGNGTCVPDVPPGLRFWGEAPKTAPGTETATVATASGATATTSDTSEAAQQCNKASGECKVIFKREGLARAGEWLVTVAKLFLVFGEKGWQPVVNEVCTTHDWVVTGNALCRSMGDCGAWYNIHGVLTKDGYINTQVDEDKFFQGKKLADSEVGDPVELLTGQGLGKSDKPGFWDDKNQVAGLIVPLAINVLGSGIAGGVAQGSWKTGFTAGLTPFGGLASAMGFLGKKGTTTIFSSTTSTVGGVSFDVGTKLTADTFGSKFATEGIKKPKTTTKYDNIMAPTGPSVKLIKAQITENIKVNQKMDKIVSDTDLISTKGIKLLYQKGIEENEITKLFSIGNLGVGINRKIVPTKWSITSIHDTLGKCLTNEIKDYKTKNLKLYIGGYMGNYYFIFFIPNIWSYELFEIYTPKPDQFSTDYEFHKGKKKYSFACGGGYYASRLSVLEKLKKNKEQATVITIRFITDEYNVPLGVWVMQNACRKALNNKPLNFETKEEMFNYAIQKAKKDYKINIKNYFKKSKIIDNLKHQKRLFEF